MNYMPREMKTQGRQLRTKVRADETGLLFVQVADPRAVLTFSLDSENLQSDVTNGIKGLFFALEQIEVDVLLMGKENEDLIWSVTASTDFSSIFEETLQVA